MTKKPTPNFPELKRLNLWVQAQDKLEPGERIWVQHNWVTLREDEPMCSTAFCVAGAAIVRAGYKLTADRAGNIYIDGNLAGALGVPFVDELSDEILGLLREEEGEEGLYDQDNTAEDIDRRIKRIFAEHDRSYARTKAAPDRKIQVT